MDAYVHTQHNVSHTIACADPITAMYKSKPRLVIQKLFYFFDDKFPGDLADIQQHALQSCVQTFGLLIIFITL